MTERLTGMKRAKRDVHVKKFRMAHGEATLKEIGERFNLTPQRVHQILKES